MNEHRIAPSLFPIRSAQYSDLDALVALYQHLRPRDDPPPARPLLEQCWADIVGRPGLTCLVVPHDRILISTTTLIVVPNLTRGTRPYAFIENVVTHSEFRRQGIGTAVINRALDIAWSANCYKVMLLTGQRPEQRRFYESCGFKADDKLGFVARPA